MLNMITLQGRLTADPEMKDIPSGTHLCNITIACERPKSKDGTKNTDFIPCIAWASTADFLKKYFHKGDQIVISGRLQSRNYETKDGQKRMAYEVSISEANFCGAPKNTVASLAGWEAGTNEEISDLPMEF